MQADVAQSLDPALIRRLWRPVERPGVIDHGLARTMLARHQRMVAGLPLAELVSRHTGSVLDPTVPIVYALPSQPAPLPDLHPAGARPGSPASTPIVSASVARSASSPPQSVVGAPAPGVPGPPGVPGSSIGPALPVVAPAAPGSSAEPGSPATDLVVGTGSPAGVERACPSADLRVGLNPGVELGNDMALAVSSQPSNHPESPTGHPRRTSGGGHLASSPAQSMGRASVPGVPGPPEVLGPPGVPGSSIGPALPVAAPVVHDASPSPERAETVLWRSPLPGLHPLELIPEAGSPDLGSARLNGAPRPARVASSATPPIVAVHPARWSRWGPPAGFQEPLPLVDLAASQAVPNRSIPAEQREPATARLPVERYAQMGRQDAGAPRSADRPVQTPAQSQRHTTAAIDVEHIVEAVHRRFVRRLAIEAERRAVR